MLEKEKLGICSQKTQLHGFGRQDHEALGDVDLGSIPTLPPTFLCDLEQSAFTPSETQFPHL